MDGTTQNETWGAMIRNVLLKWFFAVWGIVVVGSWFRAGSVPAELWAVPGVVVGALLAVFRADDRASRGRHAGGRDDTKDSEL
jgi:hypothetical protein